MILCDEYHIKGDLLTMAEVKITDERLYRQQPVTEFTCMDCGRCALVFSVELSEASISEHLRYGGLCIEAANSAVQLMNNDTSMVADIQVN